MLMLEVIAVQINSSIYLLLLITLSFILGWNQCLVMDGSILMIA